MLIVSKLFIWHLSRRIVKNNCNYILFTKFPRSGDSEGTFWCLSQAATFLPVYHTQWRLHTVPLIAERQAGKLRIFIPIVFGLTLPGIKPKSTVSVPDALSTRPLISKNRECRKMSRYRKKLSTDWREKDQWEKVICVLSLSSQELDFLSTEGVVKVLIKVTSKADTWKDSRFY